jgi:hypothetical protein
MGASIPTLCDKLNITPFEAHCAVAILIKRGYIVAARGSCSMLFVTVRGDKLLSRERRLRTASVLARIDRVAEIVKALA